MTIKPKWVSDALFQGLSVLTLHENPWSCDCGFRKMFDELVGDADKSEILRNALSNGESAVVCASPDSVAGRDVMKASSDELFTACAKPKITRISSSFEVDQGEPIVLKCDVAGFPPPLVEWRAPNDDVYSVWQMENGMRCFVLFFAWLEFV